MHWPPAKFVPWKSVENHNLMERYGLGMAKPRLKRSERESLSVENVVANPHM